MPDSPDKFIEFGHELLEMIHDFFQGKGRHPQQHQPSRSESHLQPDGHSRRPSPDQGRSIRDQEKDHRSLGQGGKPLLHRPHDQCDSLLHDPSGDDHRRIEPEPGEDRDGQGVELCGKGTHGLVPSPHFQPPRRLLREKRSESARCPGKRHSGRHDLEPHRLPGGKGKGFSTGQGFPRGDGLPEWSRGSITTGIRGA